jgi:hypothetical protein
MMTISEFDMVDLTASKGSVVKLIIAEHRDWEKIPQPDTQLLAKIAMYRKYAKTAEFRKKYGDKKASIVLESKIRIPESIKKILKAERVAFSEG